MSWTVFQRPWCRLEATYRISAISASGCSSVLARSSMRTQPTKRRSEEHTSELQSQSNLVCRLLLEKKTNVARSSLHGRTPGTERPIHPRCRRQHPLSILTLCVMSPSLSIGPLGSYRTQPVARVLDC